MQKYLLLVTIMSLFIISCSEKNNNQVQDELETKMNSIAVNYVKLVLKVGQHDKDFIDAYYGPEEFKPTPLKSAKADSAAIQNLYDEAGILLDSLDSLSNFAADEMQS